jgi:hypothetical protein
MEDKLLELKVRMKNNSKKEPIKTENFWSYNIKKRNNEIIIFPVYQNLKKWLHEQGYWRYVYSEDRWKIINIKDNIITVVFKKDVKKAVLDFILEYDYADLPIDGNMVYEEFAQRESKIFSDGIFEIIDEVDINWNKDTEDKAYYYFNNKVVVVTKDSYDLINYNKLPGMVWDSQVIKRDISIIEDYEKNDFCKFIQKVCGNKIDKINSFSTAFGYMLHGYKDCTYMPAVILTDEIISDDPNGGSGKGIIVKALSHFKNVADIDGMNFDFKSQFKFQRVNLDTQIIAFQDVPNKFNFQKLFSVITEGIEVEKKNKEQFKIPFEDSPKILVTTNYMIAGSGSSHERRKIELELANYYHSGFTPKDDFGKKLFERWNDADWNRFYNYMFDCVRGYLRYGFVKGSDGNLPYKKILTSTSNEFVEWAEENIEYDMEYNKKYLFDDFQTKYSDYLQLKQKTFSMWLDRWATYKDVKVKNRKSDKDRFIYFGKLKEK